MKQVQTNIPVAFQKIDEIDERFMRVKIWLMHLGENYNGSYFDKDVVEKALPTLANTPILGFIEDNGGEEDFSDHRMVLIRKQDGDIDVRYLGQAYGVIPQDNNAKFEFRVGDDGVTREYLTCEGLLWQKWDIPTEIIDRDLVKSQSMELSPKYAGHWDDKTGLFHFENFKFFGACILGSGVMPAMNSASIEKEFAQDEFQQQMQDKMEEFKVAFSRYQQSLADDTNTKSNKEGDDMHGKLTELLAKYSLTEDVEQVKALVLEDYATEEELEAKLVQISEEISATNHSTTCATCGNDPCGCEPPVVDPVVDPDFSVEIQSLKDELAKEKASLETLQAAFDALKSDKDKIDGEFQALTTEVEELRSFKSTKIAEERQVQEDSLYESFGSQLSAEDIASVKEASKDLTLEEIEKNLYALVGKKNFQVKQERGNVKVPTFSKKDDENTDPYGGILEKHIK